MDDVVFIGQDDPRGLAYDSGEVPLDRGKILADNSKNELLVGGDVLVRDS